MKRRSRLFGADRYSARVIEKRRTRLVTPRRLRLTLLLAAAAAAGLSACGRRGPLELPPDVQARGAALRAEQEAAQAKAVPASGPGVKGASAPAAPPPPPPIPGTTGARPPADYPFPLDPLL